MPMFVHRISTIFQLPRHQCHRSLLPLSLSWCVVHNNNTNRFISRALHSRTLEGSCQCGSVQFKLQSHTPVPYQLCACSICRKVGGYSGSVNLGGIADSLKVLRGDEHIKKYSAVKRDKGKESICSSERSFCGKCSTMLWLWDGQWPELIHPFASAIDTELPVPDEMVCIMGDSKPAWVRWPEGKKALHAVYPDDSLEGWHKKKNLFMK